MNLHFHILPKTRIGLRPFSLQMMCSNKHPFMFLPGRLVLPSTVWPLCMQRQQSPPSVSVSVHSNWMDIWWVITILNCGKMSKSFHADWKMSLYIIVKPLRKCSARACMSCFQYVRNPQVKIHSIVNVGIGSYCAPAVFQLVDLFAVPPVFFVTFRFISCCLILMDVRIN